MKKRADLRGKTEREVGRDFRVAARFARWILIFCVKKKKKRTSTVCIAVVFCMLMGFFCIDWVGFLESSGSLELEIEEEILGQFWE
ncbi:hypothetical protein H5410_052296 [Solanum commersonii]|uniref:Transmembrane protein n=1 Tax=Solanum commersonii TaxID=4109 RepID=A0A9J5X2L3_SOLCO|nr:hypothetical protein H5410_052296 [Solanum commersonii]